MYGKLLSPEYVDGVIQFMRFVQGKFSENAEILCPCSRCLNHKYLRQSLVKQNMLRNGIDSSYARWIHHGESLHADIIEHPIDEQDNGEGSIPMEAMAEDDNYGADHLHRLLHMKCLYRICNSAFTAILKLLSEAFPEHNSLPKSYAEAKGILKELGLGYDSIHVCFNNCVSFRKKYASLDNCPVCCLSRWKDPEKKKIP